MQRNGIPLNKKIGGFYELRHLGWIWRAKKLISFEKQQPSHRRSNLFYSFQVRLHLCFVLYFFWCLWLYDSQISGHSNQIQNELDTVRLNHTECLSFNIHVPRTHTLTMFVSTSEWEKKRLDQKLVIGRCACFIHALFSFSASFFSVSCVTFELNSNSVSAVAHTREFGHYKTSASAAKEQTRWMNRSGKNRSVYYCNYRHLRTHENRINCSILCIILCEQCVAHIRIQRWKSRHGKVNEMEIVH